MLLLDDAPGDGRALAEAVAAELLEELQAPFRVGGAELQLGASLGISLFPADAADAVDLLKHADAAMYQAKRASRGRHALYRPPPTTPSAGSSSPPACAPRSPATSSSCTTSPSSTSPRAAPTASRR